MKHDSRQYSRHYSLLSAIFIAILLVGTALSAPSAEGASVSGRLFDISLARASDVVVEINSSPRQMMISEDGTYRFTIKAGDYEITAGQYSDGLLVAFAIEDFSIADDGDYNMDLILFPYLGDDEELREIFRISLGESINAELGLSDEARGMEVDAMIMISGLLVIFITSGIILLLFLRNRSNLQGRVMNLKADSIKGLKPLNSGSEMSSVMDQSTAPATSTAKPASGASLSDNHTKNVLDIIRTEGGRTTQKEIRKHIPLSEAKISLIISELEAKGFIEKIKKGRGNIIILK